MDSRVFTQPPAKILKDLLHAYVNEDLSISTGHCREAFLGCFQDRPDAQAFLEQTVLPQSVVTAFRRSVIGQKVLAEMAQEVLSINKNNFLPPLPPTPLPPDDPLSGIERIWLNGASTIPFERCSRDLDDESLPVLFAQNVQIPFVSADFIGHCIFMFVAPPPTTDEFNDKTLEKIRLWSQGVQPGEDVELRLFAHCPPALGQERIIPVRHVRGKGLPPLVSTILERPVTFRPPILDQLLPALDLYVPEISYQGYNGPRCPSLYRRALIQQVFNSTCIGGPERANNREHLHVTAVVEALRHLAYGHEGIDLRHTPTQH
jgi:hypothetical protein